MSELSVQTLVDAGAHIGCRINRWNPKMEPFIFEARNRIHIIDLKETIRGILRARHFLREIVGSGQNVVFVGTKTQIRSEIKRIHEECGMPYVDDRWIGGTLTNFEVIGSRIAYLDDLEKKQTDGYLDGLSSKAAARFLREKRKVFRNLHGIREMYRLPGAMVVIDPRTERNAVREACKVGIPIVGIIDTDGDPDVCDIVIPANDDAIRSVQLILDQLSEAVQEGMRLRKERGISEPRRTEVPVRSVPTPRPRAGSRGRRPPGLPRPTSGRRAPSTATLGEKVPIKPMEDPVASETPGGAASDAAPAQEKASPEKTSPETTPPEKAGQE